MKSICEMRGGVSFPMFTGERVYMRRFTKAAGLPFDLARWQPTVDAMLAGVETDGPIYLMVDQGRVEVGKTQRRPGLHIDGYWREAVHAHGQTPCPCPGDNGRHGPSPGRHVSLSGSWDQQGDWRTSTFSDPEALILASNISASRAYIGEWLGHPHEGGDCSHIDVSGLREVGLVASRVYAGNVTMLHESLPVDAAGNRTLVRLSVPGWNP